MAEYFSIRRTAPPRLTQSWRQAFAARTHTASKAHEGNHAERNSHPGNRLGIRDFAKGRLLKDKRRPFTRQEVAFHNPKGHLLAYGQANAACRTQSEYESSLSR